MAIGDASNILGRLKSLIPPGWFDFAATLRDAVLGGLSDDLAANYALLQAVKAATRLKSSAGWLLDLAAWDFFGPRLIRFASERDGAFFSRIIKEIFRERVTRKGISQALFDLTGRVPAIFDPPMPSDTGGYGISTMGYGVAGAYGSLRLPNQLFITAFRPMTNGIPLLNGYGGYAGGYGIGTIAYASINDVQGVVTDDAIRAVVASTVASGVNPNLSISD